MLAMSRKEIWGGGERGIGVSELALEGRDLGARGGVWGSGG